MRLMSPELVDLIAQGEQALAAADWDAARTPLNGAETVRSLGADRVIDSRRKTSPRAA